MKLGHVNPLGVKVNSFQRKTGMNLFAGKKHKMYTMCTSCLSEPVQFKYEDIMNGIPQQSKLAVSNVLHNAYLRKNDWTLIYGILHIAEDGEPAMDFETAHYHAMTFEEMSRKVTERIKDMVPKKSDGAIGNFWFHVPSIELDEDELLFDIRHTLDAVDAWGAVLKKTDDFGDLKVKYDNYVLRNCIMMS